MICYIFRGPLKAAADEAQVSSAPAESSAPSKPEQSKAPSKPEQSSAPSKPETEQSSAPSKPEPKQSSAPSKPEPEQSIAPSKPEQSIAPSDPEQSSAPSDPKQSRAPTKPDQSVLQPQSEQKQSPSEDLQPSTDNKHYEHGYDATHGKAWRKEIIGERMRGPVQWSKPPERDPTKQPLDPVQCMFEDGMLVEIPHLTQELCMIKHYFHILIFSLLTLVDKIMFCSRAAIPQPKFRTCMCYSKAEYNT